MSEKVVITKEQAEELLNLKEWSNREILKIHSNDNYGWDLYKGLNGMDFDTLAKALYIGYEVEPTPEEYISERYEKAKINVKGDIHPEYNQGVVDAIEMVLRTLKIKIERVHK